MPWCPKCGAEYVENVRKCKDCDVRLQVVSNIQNYLIAFGVVLVLALLVMFAVRKMPKAKKKMIRAQSGLAILLALAAALSLQGLL